MKEARVYLVFHWMESRGNFGFLMTVSKINVAVVTVVFETVHLKDCCVKILASVILAFWSQT